MYSLLCFALLEINSYLSKTKKKRNLNLLFHTCRWQVKEEEVEEGDAKAVGGATTHYHQPLTNKPS